MKYKKKPVIIEAFKVPTVERLTDVTLTQHVVPAWVLHSIVNEVIVLKSDECKVVTKEGTMTGKPGDYIIKGVQGELYICDAEIFKQTYTYEDGKKIDD